jgi:alkylation response protein AidB-like acyl-CoA dehydrogenase
MTTTPHRKLTAAQAVTACDTIPLVRATRTYADEALRPAALKTDRHGVTPKTVAELADRGLLNHVAPPEFGGGDLDRSGDRRVHEIIAGGCFNTWLVWAQHAPVVRKLADLLAAGTPLPDLGYQVLRGRVLVGAAVSDVRRYPRNHISANRTAEGWVFSGTVSWVSGWGLNTVLLVAAVDDTTETVVTALVPIGPGIRSSPLALAAVEGSRTERVTLHDVGVPAGDVIATQSLSDWRREDLSIASDARGHHFGLADTVLDELAQAESARAREVAQAWRPRVDQLRSDAYGLADEAKAAKDEQHRIDERLATKVAIGDALGTVTRALLAARSGRGLALDDTAQLHARSALFVLVQGQSADVRDAQLAHFAHLAQ